MATVVSGPVRPVSLQQQEVELARESSSALADFASHETEPLVLHIENGHTGRHMQATVPAGAVRVLAEVLSQMAQGCPVTLVSLEAELSTQQAAEIMGVSRPFFVKLLESGRIPFRKIGEHRRVRYQDLLDYLEANKTARMRALDEMTAEAQQLGLYE
jgi:excisionase family DNA binding protein